MRDMASKMAELKFEAPLAQFEETDDWSSSTGDFQTAISIHNNKSNEDELNYNRKNNSVSRKELMDDTAELLLMNEFNEEESQLLLTDNSNNMLGDILGPPTSNGTNVTTRKSTDETDNFTETFSGSLEDLVNTFDEKITKCFGNYEESVEKLAPVQVRTQEEIMNECQMWWTITGNFGNILPIDWSKSYARKMHMPALNLNENKEPLTPDDDLELLSSEDEAVASDLDMHALILGGLHPEPEPLKTAEEVIREIDDMIMQEDLASIAGDHSPDDSEHHLHHHHRASHEALEKAKEVLNTPLYEDKLRDLSLSQLNELYMELEVLIREFSETLIAELAHRDELEYEKELKNTFISLLLAVQNKRRQYHVEKKRSAKASNGVRVPSNGLDPKYLTTVIPYHLDSGPPNNQSLQVLIKILKAINEDSPTVPTLLTDYILKVICPT